MWSQEGHEHKDRRDELNAEIPELAREVKQAKAEFDRLQTQFKQAQATFNRRLEEIKSESQRERDRTLDRAGVRYSERSDAKIVKKTDGTTQIYHGGLGSGDGIGHGHTALDQSGRVIYDRDSFFEC